MEANTWRPEQMTHTFQMAFPDEISPWKCFYIDSNFTESRGVHLNESALVQVNRLLPNRHHAITWTKVNKDLSWHMTSLSHDELNKFTLVQVIGCCLINTKLLPEPNLTKISLAIWHHQAKMSWIIDSNFTESWGVYLNESVLVQVIGCCLINIMLLLEPMLTKTTVAVYIGHQELKDPFT